MRHYPLNTPWTLSQLFQKLRRLINLLMHQDQLIRDTAREALGSELSPKFYAKLIRFMDECVYIDQCYFGDLV